MSLGSCSWGAIIPQILLRYRRFRCFCCDNISRDVHENRLLKGLKFFSRKKGDDDKEEEEEQVLTPPPRDAELATVPLRKRKQEETSELYKELQSMQAADQMAKELVDTINKEVDEYLEAHCLSGKSSKE